MAKSKNQLDITSRLCVFRLTILIAMHYFIVCRFGWIYTTLEPFVSSSKCCAILINTIKLLRHKSEAAIERYVATRVLSVAYTLFFFPSFACGYVCVVCVVLVSRCAGVPFGCVHCVSLFCSVLDRDFSVTYLNIEFESIKTLIIGHNTAPNRIRCDTHVYNNKL